MLEGRKRFLSQQRKRFFTIFIYLFMAALGLYRCMRAFSSCGEWGYSRVVVLGLLIGVASHVEHRLWAHGLQ